MQPSVMGTGTGDWIQFQRDAAEAHQRQQLFSLGGVDTAPVSHLTAQPAVKGKAFLHVLRVDGDVAKALEMRLDIHKCSLLFDLQRAEREAPPVR